MLQGHPFVLASMVELQDGCFGCTGVICYLGRMSGSHGIFVFVFLSRHRRFGWHSIKIASRDPSSSSRSPFSCTL